MISLQKFVFCKQVSASVSNFHRGYLFSKKVGFHNKLQQRRVVVCQQQMSSVGSIGGSLTGALVIVGIALGIRWIRAQQQKVQSKNKEVQKKQMKGRYFAIYTPQAVRMLAEMDPIPHFLIDLRSQEEVDAAPMPRELQNSILQLAENEIERTLRNRSAWQLKAGPKKYPSEDTLFVFVGNSEEQMSEAASEAAAAGFQRCGIVRGGVEGLQRMGEAVDMSFVNRDAVALMLELRQKEDPEILPEFTLIDTRRRDERTLYGSIPGAVHLPTDQMNSALGLEEDDFERIYSFKKPQSEDLLIFQCRTNRRAKWCAQLAADSGFSRILVYKQGVYGWRLDGSVKPYESYELNDPPPEPEQFTIETIDRPTAEKELEQLGLLSISKQ
eukprot:TRINITY_DN40757_c0_g1_i1.p2 TRINITY_DN40757_c0_g1~~TRINITY_DN40757_c0_g1_i1.p2  ORF type:complete len:397 (+),score=66.52 TRINITY_DN40757_c0_g1_i1:40-1191(+)